MYLAQYTVRDLSYAMYDDKCMRRDACRVTIFAWQVTPSERLGNSNRTALVALTERTRVMTDRAAAETSRSDILPYGRGNSEFGNKAAGTYFHC